MTLRPALTALLSDPFAHDAIRAAYDTVAVDYTREFGDDLARLPLDREMLDTALTRRCRLRWRRGLDTRSWLRAGACSQLFCRAGRADTRR